MGTQPQASFFSRNEFLIRRLHSLTGLVPVGAYMMVHLVVNASIWNGDSSFQNAVYKIHSLGVVLPVVEWVFIFIPLLFHAIFGVVIVRTGTPNSSAYPYPANLRYTAQRATGMLAFLFIAVHVFHMHGWFHADWWLELVVPLGGAQFHPYNAASSASEAISPSWISGLYLLGVAVCVFHLINGIWTMGITWGIWTTPKSQKLAGRVCLGAGVIASAIGLAAWSGFTFTVDHQQAVDIENRMYSAQTEAGTVIPDSHKRTATGNHD